MALRRTNNQGPGQDLVVSKNLILLKNLITIDSAGVDTVAVIFDYELFTAKIFSTLLKSLRIKLDYRYYLEYTTILSLTIRESS